MSHLNTIRAILILNAKRGPAKGSAKAKGWTDEARKKAALTRKAKAKVKAGRVAKAAKAGAKPEIENMGGAGFAYKHPKKGYLTFYKTWSKNPDNAAVFGSKGEAKAKGQARDGSAKKPAAKKAAKVAKAGANGLKKSEVKKAAKPISLGGGGALKTRNELTKHFGLKKTWSGDSNPYSDTQRLTGAVSRTQHKALLKHLDHPDSGWTKDNSKVMSGYNFYTKGNDTVTVTDKPYTSIGGKQFNSVRITGPKKKKAYTIPYYD